MPTESASLSLLSVISLLSFFVALMVNKFSPKIGNGVLMDKDFEKPQAFHKELVPRSGGLAGMVSLTIFFILYYFLFEEFLFNYFILSIAIFFLGFLEDIKFKISPNYRLILMILILIFFISFFSVDIRGVDVPFLSTWMKNSAFSIAFTLLCFLFIINGANLVDGFNGLLTIHLLIVNSILMFLNFNNGNHNLAWIITAQIIILFSFLVFNFPKAKIFLGDSGAYFLGTFIAVTTIKTSIANPVISPFYFCILLFYLFFEVFFSFFRKLIKERTSPIHPDKKHLHMLLYKFLLKKNNNKIKSNYYVSVIINLFYFTLNIPAILMMNNGMFCKYYSIVFLLIYFFSYRVVYEKVK